jgi:DNA-binding response OmpR family regulator
MSDKVLIIDDDPRLVEALRIRLEFCGYSIHTAYCGIDGWSATKRLRPRVIVLDVNMPGMDGLQVCRLIRAEPELATTSIIVISALSHETARQAALDAGANQFIGKPYKAAQVIAAICGAIENRLAEEGASTA